MKRYSYLLALFAAIVLQIVLVPVMTIRWFRPDLPLLVVIYLAMRKGGVKGIVAGFITGLFIDSFSTQYLGLSSLTYSIAAFIAGRFYYSPDRVILVKWLSASGFAILLSVIIFSHFYTLTSTPSFWTLLIHHALPTAFYTWALGAIWGISPLFIRR